MDTGEGKYEYVGNGEYKKVVEKIRELRWEDLEPQDLQQLMFLSLTSAKEFAEALRIAVRLYPDNRDLGIMVQGELQTDNLVFGEYSQMGDHADFLEYFLHKYNFTASNELMRVAEQYLEQCHELSDEVRAMTIFSREEELPGIFQRILEAKDWDAPGLIEFRFYLERHIQIDTEVGGHHDLTKEFPVDDRVKEFYEARLQMYRALPNLFGNDE